MSFRDLRRALIASNCTPVAIEAARSSTLELLGVRIARGDRVTDAELAAVVSQAGTADDLAGARVMAEKLAAPTLVPGAKGLKQAIVSFRGLVTYDLEFQPYAVSTRNFAAVMRALAADASVSSITIVCDSPGGTVYGLPEAADAVWEARQKKKVVAAVDILCASAAYYVVSQATEISAMPSGAGVGSIGVRMMHVDCSKMLENAGVKFTHIHSGEYKVEGNPYEPLSDEARARYQYESDVLYKEFVATVARGRETTIENVLENFGKGRVLMPVEAKRAGMIDRLEPVESALGRLGVVVMTADATESVEPEAASTASVDSPSAPQVEGDEKVNQELNGSSEVDTAAAADLDRRRRLLRLTAA